MRPLNATNLKDECVDLAPGLIITLYFKHFKKYISILNFVFTSNTIHIKFCIIFEFEKDLEPTFCGRWCGSPAGAPKTAQPALRPNINLGAPAKMLLVKIMQQKNDRLISEVDVQSRVANN
jgi:hypothetical protein